MHHIDPGTEERVLEYVTRSCSDLYTSYRAISSNFYIWLWCPHWPDDTFLLSLDTLTTTLNHVKTLIPLMKQVEDSHNSLLTLCPNSSYRHCRFHCICRYRPYLRMLCKYRPDSHKKYKDYVQELRSEEFLIIDHTVDYN